MGKNPAIQLYVGDYLRDSVCGCSLAAQGLWLRLLLVMHDCEPYGHLTQNGSEMPEKAAANRCGTDLGTYRALIAELTEAGVPSFTAKGVLFSRRMVRDEANRKAEREKKQRQRCPSGVPPDVPALSPPMSRDCPVPSSSSSSTSSSLSLKKRESQERHKQEVQAARDKKYGN